MKNKLIKGLCIGMMAVSVIFTNQLSAKAEWKQDKTGWWYQSGNTYLKNTWKQIDGKWYYFDYDGYMLTNNIIDGKYYVNAKGEMTTPPIEVQKYMEVLKDVNLLKSKYNFNIYSKNTSGYSGGKVLDINGDGILEVMCENSTCHANQKTSILQYKNGEVKLMAEVRYHAYKIPNKNIIITEGIYTGGHIGSVYEANGDGLKEIHTYCWYDMANGNYSIDNQKVNKDTMFKFLKSYNYEYEDYGFHNVNK